MGKRDISLPSILGVWETWGSRTLYFVVLVPTEWAQLHSHLAKGSAELAGKLDGMGQAGGAWQSPLPRRSAMDVPELILGTWDLLVWTWGTSGLWDARLKLHSRARLIAGNATKPFSPQLIAGAMISLLPT